MAKRSKATAAKSRKLPYTEGTWFAVPLKKSGYVVGIIARHGHLDALFGYFFGPKRRTVPTQKAIENLRPENALLRCKFNHVGLLKRRWPIIGTVESWDRADWPLPPFIIFDEFEHTAMEVIYSEDLRKVLSCRRCDPKLAKVYPEDDFAGHIFLEEILTDRFTRKKRSRPRAVSRRKSRPQGYDAFASDDAADWVADLCKSEGVNEINAALDAVIKTGDGYLDLPQGSKAIAACEVIAALSRKPSTKIPDEVKIWISNKPRAKPLVVKKAKSVIKRVLQLKKSELADLWNESPDCKVWNRNVRGLLKRLSG